MTVSIRINLRAPRVIPRDFGVYSQVFTSLALRELELATIGEQTQSRTTELPSGFTFFLIHP